MCHIDIGVGCRTKVEFDTITINKKNDTRKRTISIFDTSYIEADTIATFDIYIKAFVQYILLCLHRQHGGARFDAIMHEYRKFHVYFVSIYRSFNFRYDIHRQSTHCIIQQRKIVAVFMTVTAREA